MNPFFADNAAVEGLGQESLQGGAISIVARAVMAVIQVGSVLFLSRLLSPEDYGLVAMVTAIIGFAPLLVDLGTRDAVVQRVQITEREVSSLFWMTAVIGSVFAILTALIGPVISRFYGEPRLTTISLVSALNFVVIALATQHQALMRRAGMFRDLAIVELVANLLSAVLAAGIAFWGFGYWALVTRPLSMYCFMAVGVWWRCPWLPGRWSLTTAVKEMVKFGSNLTGFTLLDFAGRNIDRVAIGRGLGATLLGYYQQALFVYYNVLDVLVYTLHQVAITGLSKLQDEHAEFRRCWAKALSTMAFFAMPIFGVLAVTSQDIVVQLLGKRWSTAGLILSVLALRGIPHVVERSSGWLYVSTGRADRLVRYGVLATLIQVVALLCGLPFGLLAVALAYVLSMFVLFVPAVVYAGSPVDIGARDVIRTVGPQLAGSLIAAAVGFSLRYWVLVESNSLLRALDIGAAYLAIYFVIVPGILNVREPLWVLRGAVRALLPGFFILAPVGTPEGIEVDKQYGHSSTPVD